MAYDTLFDTDENKTLAAICTRKLISNIGIGGIIWGIINIAIGIGTVHISMLNVGVIILGVIMLATGFQAIRKPSLGILLTETIVTVLLLLWNIGISTLNFLAIGKFDPRGLVLPIVVVFVFSNYYIKLGHLREKIESIEPEKIKTTKQMCKDIIRTKLKDEPSVVETANKRCRAQLMDKNALFIQRDLMRAFIALKEDIQKAIIKPDAKCLAVRFNHPVGKLIYQFNKKNSDKLKNWLSCEFVPAESAK
jgi:hypothetical protein